MEAVEEKEEIVCGICGQSFTSRKAFHAHLKKHKILLVEYYPKYQPKFNLLTGEPIPFKSTDQYLNADFRDVRQMKKWLDTTTEKNAKEYLLKKLKKKIKDKKLKEGPCHVYLTSAKLPGVDQFKKFFGSYTAACEEIGVKPCLNQRLPCAYEEALPSDLVIFKDTREQKPLSFSYTTLENKLDFADYTLAGDRYNGTYIERKSAQDFKGSLSTGLGRLQSELKRARRVGAFIFFVVESTQGKIYTENMFGPHRANLDWIYSNMRSLLADFPDVCQFVFVYGRGAAAEIAPYLLHLGPKLRKADIQYYVENNDLDSWQTEY